jgi:Ala-tRNA(Pro) deacylase
MSARNRIDALLAALGIKADCIEHPPVHTVEEALPYWASLDAVHTKNLFLRDAKSNPWLLCAAADRRVDLKAVAKRVGAKRFSFASEELLFDLLGVRQGAVSPLALINDSGCKVRLILDAELIHRQKVAFHPLVNTATMAMAAKDFLAVLMALGHPPEIVAMGEA